MPTTLNSPNLWFDQAMDALLNQADRAPRSDGSYDFKKTQQPEIADTRLQKFPANDPMLIDGGRPSVMNPRQYNDWITDIINSIVAGEKRLPNQYEK